MRDFYLYLDFCFLKNNKKDNIEPQGARFLALGSLAGTERLLGSRLAMHSSETPLQQVI